MRPLLRKPSQSPSSSPPAGQEPRAALMEQRSHHDLKENSIYLYTAWKASSTRNRGNAAHIKCIQMSNDTKDTRDKEQQTISRLKGMTSYAVKTEAKRQSANERRDRPRKLRVFSDDLPHSEDLYEPDIDSFVSTCTHGISFGNNNNDDGTIKEDILSPRAAPIHKRHFPSLSFLATTTIAAEKKKMKIAEEKRKEAIAEMEARKALALNPLESAVDVDKTKEEEPSSGEKISLELQSTIVKDTSASNVTMPPLLKSFLHELSKSNEEKKVDRSNP